MMQRVQGRGIDLAPADRQPPRARPGQREALAPAVLTRPVLIIEDEAVIAWTLESLLEEMGFRQIAIAASGAEAQSLARQLAPGLIISDINLGSSGMDGVAAAAAIVAGSEAAVVFITGYAGADARQRIARDMPAAMLLRKPVNAADLHRTIATVSQRNGQ